MFKKSLLVIICLIFVTACSKDITPFVGTYFDINGNKLIINTDSTCSYTSYDTCKVNIISSKEIRITYISDTEHITVFDLSDEGLISKEGIKLTKVNN